jgi:dihydropteroate synthase
MTAERMERKRYTLALRGAPWALGEKTLIMGIINVTPDSFSDGGEFYTHESAIDQVRRMLAAGVDLIDIGGESTRPFSDPVSAREERDRVIPLIESIRSETDIPISIDTTKAEVAEHAIRVGADIINDVSALRFDPEMASLAAATQVPLILMHMLGIPKTMQKDPHYDSLFSEIIGFLEARIQYALSEGVDRNQIIVDPGIGFGKTVAHNLLLVRELSRLSSLDRPILMGASRKRFIGTILDRPVEQREQGTAAVNVCSILGGAHFVRVHDVAAQQDAVKIADALLAVKV